MARNNRPRVEIDRETRTMEISRMIAEGGLGTEATHYKVVKRNARKGVVTATGNILNELVANLGVLFVKLHQYHWHVTGSEFYTLHEKFEELYNQALAHFDEFAERLVTKGERPYSTLLEFLQHATISEKPYFDPISSEQMVGNLITDYETLKAIALDGIEAAQEENDPVSEDMFIGFVQQTDLNVWMLRSFINK